MKKLLKIFAILFGLFLLLIVWASQQPHDISVKEQATIDLSKKYFGESGAVVKALKKDSTYRNFAITHEHFEKANLLLGFASEYCSFLRINEKETKCFLRFYKYSDQVNDTSEIGMPVATYNYVPATKYVEATLTDNGKTYSTKSIDDTSLDEYFKAKGITWELK